MSYQPPQLSLGASDSNLIDDHELGQRIRIVADRNPYMADRPDILAQMASSPYDTPTLTALAGQAYAMQAGDSFAEQLKGLTPSTQRSIIARLSPGQQSALAQMGFKAPDRHEGSFLGDVAGLVAKPLGVISRGASAIPGVSEAFGATIEGLNWVGNWPGHLYRTIETMDSHARWAALGGAVLGGLAVAAAPFTGGASLVTLGAISLGALGGASAAAAITNPNDWWRAFNHSWNGERTFRLDAQQRAADLLDDPRVHGLAQDLAGAGVNIVDFAHELAGHRGIDTNSQLKVMEDLAGRMATKGTPEFQQVIRQMNNALLDPNFQKAVTELNNGKISIGRDLADAVPGLKPGSTIYNLVSGTADAAFTVAADPTLMLGYGSKLYKAERLTFAAFDGAEAASAFRRFVGSRPALARTYDALAEAVAKSDSGGLQILRSKVPQLEPLYGDLVHYRRSLIDQGLIKKVEFSRSDVIEYLANQTKFKPLLEGKGSVRNVTGKGIQLYAVSAPNAAFRAFRSDVRSLVNGLADVSTEAKLAKLAKRADTTTHEYVLQQIEALARDRGRDFEELLPTSLHDMIGIDGEIAKPWRFGDLELNPNAYATGRAFAGYARKVPILGRSVGKVGEALTAMTTMSISGKAVSLVGDAATREVRALSELGRYMGMPSYWRRAWADYILSADSPGARFDAMQGWLANALRLTGADATPEGERLIGEYLQKSRQLYGASDEVIVNGHPLHAGLFMNEQADKVVMPDLHELRRITTTSHIASAVMGIVDLPVMESLMNKVWKPAVLLRLGFIPRAAGEEMVSFMLRSGLGSLIQESGARGVGQMQAYREAAAKATAARARGLEPVLTQAEKALLDRGWLSLVPSHMRPVARMLGRGSWEDPVMGKMLSYSKWVEARLSEGLGRDAYGGLSRLEAQRKGLVPLSRPALIQHNLSSVKDSILLGNPYSVRRMILGGVHDDLIDAGKQWAAGHSTTVMRELSAITAGPVDPGFDSTKIHTVLEADPRTKELRPVVMMSERGVRQNYARGEDGFANALLEGIQRSLADPAYRADAIDFLSRVRGGANVSEFDLGKHADGMLRLFGKEAPHANAEARLITRELLGSDFHRQHWEQMLVEMRRGGQSHTADALDAYLKQIKDPTLADVRNALLNARADLKPSQFADEAAYMAARKHLDEVRARLEDVTAPALDYLGGLDRASREFAAQFLNGTLLGGSGSWWGRRAATLGEGGASEPWLYDTLNDARGARVDNLQAKVLDPNYHDLGATKSLRAHQVDETGQYVDSAMRDDTVLLYETPYLHGATYDEVLRNATNRELVVDNRHVIEAILNGDPRETQLVADYRIANELQRIDARMAGLSSEAATRPRMLRQPRSVMDGRIHDNLIPDVATKRGDSTHLWHYPRQAADKHLVPTPDLALDPTRQWAEDMVARGDDLVRRGNTQLLRAKGRVASDGSPMPLLYEYDRKRNLVPISPGTEVELSKTHELYDYLGQRVHYGDTRFFDTPLREGMDVPTGNVMWEALGPSMRDAQETHYGAERLVSKKATAKFSIPGKPVQTNDLVPLQRASRDDILRVPLDDLPSNAIGEVYTNRKVGPFEKVVQFGFDRVIGPSIDAFVRKPMAFHYYAQRYIAAKHALSWTLDPELIAKMGELRADYSTAIRGLGVNPEDIGNMVKDVARYHGEGTAHVWSTDHAMAWVRGHSSGEIQDLLTRTLSSAAHDGSDVAQAARRSAAQLQRMGTGNIQLASAETKSMEAMLDSMTAELPENWVGIVRDRQHQLVAAEKRGPEEAAAVRDRLAKDEFGKAIDRNGMLRHVEDTGQWDTVIAAHTNVEHQRKAAGEIAAVASINDAMPFIDSHEFKTQFADYGKGLVPFWYAEENFMKRWARGLVDEGPALIRKAQLGYMGMKEAGIIRTDQSGRDWFVYPGSGLLVDTLSRIPGLSNLQNMGVMFETPTSQMLPGLNNRFGVPSFNPLVTIPMDLTRAMFPELQPVERAVLGDFASEQGVWNQLVPAHFRNLHAALFGDERSSARYANAMSVAIAFAEAHGQGPPDNATPGEVDEFMDRVRKHARIIVIAQALGGFLVPGAPSELAAGQSANITGINVDNPADYLANEYLSLVRTMGVEEGTARYLELNKDASIDNVVNPLAYTVPKNVSTSGAPIPSTEDALRFVDSNADYFNEFPNAAPWLIPQNYANGQRSQYAYDQQVADGMRDRRTPEELFRAMKFKIGAQEYFVTRDTYMQAIEQATEANDKAAADALRTQMDWKLAVYRVAHPLFAEELQSSDGRERRARVLSEMRTVVDDPQHPDAPHFDTLALAMHTFDDYTVRLSVLQNDRSISGRREVDHLKTQYQSFMESLVAVHPEITTFWTSVLRPESSLT